MNIFKSFERAVSPSKQSAVRVVSSLMAIGLLILSGGDAQAAIIANYTFDGESLASSDTEANSTAGSISKGPGLGSNSAVVGNEGNGAPSFKFATRVSGTVLDADDYISFTVTANSGYVLNLNGGSVTLQVGTANEGLWAVRSSVDSFLADLGSGTGSSTGGANATPVFNPSTVNLSGTGFDNLSTVTFRLYGWDSLNMGSDALWFDNIALNGSVVPEPVSVALGIFGAGFGVFQVGRWLRRRKSAASVG